VPPDDLPTDPELGVRPRRPPHGLVQPGRAQQVGEVHREHPGDRGLENITNVAGSDVTWPYFWFRRVREG
jgi:hypothetical protein